MHASFLSTTEAFLVENKIMINCEPHNINSQAISKLKYGQCKNLDTIVEAELRMRIPEFDEIV